MTSRRGRIDDAGYARMTTVISALMLRSSEVMPA
jgi:hypothetical protein